MDNLWNFVYKTEASASRRNTGQEIWKMAFTVCNLFIKTLLLIPFFVFLDLISIINLLCLKFWRTMVNLPEAAY